MGFFAAQAQEVIGKWKTIDDKTGMAKSIVEIYPQNGKLYGKVAQILEKGKENKSCIECDGANKDQPVKGMVIIDGLTEDGDTWENGTILDPENGKIYKCYITLVNANQLKVRGYIGFTLFGRTQYWTRVSKEIGAKGI
jgi:uncharacterized protein (DUF2147 family)